MYLAIFLELLRLPSFHLAYPAFYFEMSCDLTLYRLQVFS